MKQFLGLFILVGSLLFSEPQLVAQQIVHALCGTVSAINTSNKTITLFQDSGSPATFHVMDSPTAHLSFDKQVAGEVTAAKDFQKKGAYVVLFYFGIDENRTAVALKSLGAGPFSSATGEVTGWNEHSHTVSMHDKSGAAHSFVINAQTIAETYMGVVNGTKVDLEKGEQVRLVSSVNNGTPTVLFIREK